MAANGGNGTGRVETPPKVAPGETMPKGELGTIGVPVWAGRVYNEWNPALQGDLGLQQFREMVDDPIMAGFLYGVDKLCRKVPWHVVPADGDEDDTLARFVASCIDDMLMSWHETLSQIMTMLPYGFEVSEIVYKQRVGPTENRSERRSKFSDGLIGWRKFAHREQVTRWAWDVDYADDVKGWVQWAPPLYIEQYIPVARMLLFRTQAISPEGKSILRGAWSSWRMKNALLRVEGIGAERDMVGTPYAMVPPEWLAKDADADQIAARNNALAMVTSIKVDENQGFLAPAMFDDKGNKLFEIGLLGSPGQRQFDIDGIISRYDQRISMSVMADFILLGHEQIGSYNLGGAKIDLFSAALQAYLDTIAEVVNSNAIPRLLRINGFDVARSPRLVPGQVFDQDLDALGNFFLKLSQAGAELFPGNPGLLSELLRRANISPEVISEVEREARRLGSLPGGPSNAMPPPPAPTGPGAKPASGKPAPRPGQAKGIAVGRNPREAST